MRKVSYKKIYNDEEVTASEYPNIALDSALEQLERIISQIQIGITPFEKIEDKKWENIQYVNKVK